MRSSGRLIITALAAALSFGCSAEQPSPLGVEVDDERTLRLLVTCASEVTATVTESDAEVRIDEISGKDGGDGDCLGGVSLDLERPLGDRALVVEGDAWRRIVGECPYGDFSPPDAELHEGCTFTP